MDWGESVSDRAPVLEEKSANQSLSRKWITHLPTPFSADEYLLLGAWLYSYINIILNRQHMVSGKECSSLPITPLFAGWWRKGRGCHGSLTVAANYPQELSIRRKWLLGADSTEPFAFKEVSFLILGFFISVTPVQWRIRFKDIKPSPGTYQTWWIISNSLQHYSPKSCGGSFFYPTEDD